MFTGSTFVFYGGKNNINRQNNQNVFQAPQSMRGDENLDKWHDI